MVRIAADETRVLRDVADGEPLELLGAVQVRPSPELAAEEVGLGGAAGELGPAPGGRPPLLAQVIAVLPAVQVPPAVPVVPTEMAQVALLRLLGALRVLQGVLQGVLLGGRGGAEAGHEDAGAEVGAAAVDRGEERLQLDLLEALQELLAPREALAVFFLVLGGLGATAAALLPKTSGSLQLALVLWRRGGDFWLGHHRVIDLCVYVSPEPRLEKMYETSGRCLLD